MRQLSRKERVPVILFQGMLFMYVLTAVILLLLAVLLYKYDISKGAVSTGIIVAYVLSGFAGGLFMGKRMKTRRFFWGLTAGGVYFLVLTLVSIGFHHGLSTTPQNFILTLILCTASGMAGGMIS